MADAPTVKSAALAPAGSPVPFYKHPHFPYYAAGGVAVALIALRLHAVAKLKAAGSSGAARLKAGVQAAVAAPASPPPQGNVVAPPSPQVAAALPPLLTNPDGTARTSPNAPISFPNDAAAAAAVAAANAAGISVAQVVLQQQGQLSPATGPVVTAPGQQAVVTTNDPPPMGDLIIRDAPNGTQIGGVDKDGLVTILNADPLRDGVWAQITWGGGRNAAATGFVHKKFLRLI